MLIISEVVAKTVSKGKVPKTYYKNIKDALREVDKNKDMTLFDIIKMVGNYNKTYYRIKKGKYRAIFYFENENIHVYAIGKREDIYNTKLI